MSDPVIRFDRVTRRFGDTTALDAFSLEVEPGTVLGLLGRNGAGKTTSLRLVHGLLHPDDGEIRVLGLDPVRQGIEVRTRVSLLSEESHLHPWMTVGEIVAFGRRLHPGWDDELSTSLQKRLDLAPEARVASLSRGTRAKVALLLAVSSRPSVLLLDDPTAGLDPLVRRQVLEGVLETIPAEGGAVIYASHLVHDVERVADRVVFLDRGSIRLDAPLEALKLEVRRVTAVFEHDAPMVDGLPQILDQTVDGRVLTVLARGNEEEVVAVVRGLGPRSVEIDSVPLEEILVACLRNGAGTEVDVG